MPWYLDTSAFLKLVVAEKESPAMQEWLVRNHPMWSSQLLRSEALRAGARLGIDEESVEHALGTVSLILPATSTFWTAGKLAPPTFRTLDSLHLATALELGDELDGIVTYDARMTDAARALSIRTVAPA